MTFREKPRVRLCAFAVAASFALALAGCGGGGGSATTTPDPVPMPGPANAQRAAIDNAITAATTAVGMVNDTADDAAVTAAENAVAAVKTAIANAADLPAAEKAAHGETVAVLEGRLTAARTSRTAYMDEADAAMKAAMAAAGKALHGALGTAPLNNLDRTTNAGGAVWAATGPTINTADNADTDPQFKAGDAAGALGSWKGVNYTLMGEDTSHTALVYTNQAAPTPAAFGAVHSANYDADSRTLTLTADVDDNIAGPNFPTAGTTTYNANAPGRSEESFPGTYDGVAGTYFCTITTGNACTARYTPSGFDLGANWTFVHPKGAMVAVADADYLYFGWWLQKDKDGAPTSASAFYGAAGTPPTAPIVSGEGLLGSATYSGNAAGKFAVNNPFGGSDAGDFTADVALTARFGPYAAPNNGGITGAINNFMANGKPAPWSVELQRARWGGDPGSFISTDDTNTNDTDETSYTVWSIDGNAAPESGSWRGQVYDEAADDGSDVPTTVIGVFESRFDSTHTMVGAFGATRD